MGGPAGVASKGFVDDGSTAGLGDGPTGQSARGDGTGEDEGGGIDRYHPADAGAVEVIGENFGGGGTFRAADGLDGDIDLACLLDHDDRSGGLGVEIEGKK